VQNREVAPKARWVAAIKTVPAEELSKNEHKVAGELFSDDEDALNKAKALFEACGFPIKHVGPLIEARKSEEKLWHWIKKTVLHSHSPSYLTLTSYNLAST
jgi:predicted dinucleotide-binding enzyme